MAHVGDTLGAYELIAELGRGGMATLYLAWRTGPSGFARPVAVKVVHPELVGDPAFVTMFLDEARLSARVQHPNVVHVEELGEHEGTHYLVMEYVDGVTLSDVLRSLHESRRSVPVDVAVCVAAQVADGLHGAHESVDESGRPLGIVHRDVSPQNILLGSHGHVKIIDFGVARAAGRRTSTEQGAIKGKLAYMTAEQLSGLAVDRRADVFALGVVLWEMLTMRRLFLARTDTETMQRILDGDVPRLRGLRPEVPEALDAAVHTALARDRDERFQTASAFRRALIGACPDSLFVDADRIGELVRGAARDALERRREVVPAEVREATLVSMPPAEAEHQDVESAGYDVSRPLGEQIASAEAELDRARGTDAVIEARALGQLIGLLGYAGELERAAGMLAWMRRLVADAPPGLRAWAASLEGQIAAAAGDLAARLEAQRASRELYEEAGWPMRAARAAVNVADIYNQLGAYERAERELTVALARARQLELPGTEAYALLNLARSLTMQDRVAEAEARLDEATRVADARGLSDVAMIATVYRAHALCRAGRWTAARAEAERGASLAASAGARSVEAAALAHAGRAALASGDLPFALDASERAVRLRDELGGLEENEGDVFLLRIHALAAAGRAEDAERVRTRAVERVEEMAIKIVDPTWRRSFLRHMESHAALLADGD